MNIVATASRRLGERIQTLTGIFSKVPDNIGIVIPSYLDLFRVIKPSSATNVPFDYINFSELDSETTGVPSPNTVPYKVLAQATITAPNETNVFKTINFEATITDTTDESATGGQTTDQKIIAQMDAGFSKANTSLISGMHITDDIVFVDSILVKYS